MYVHACLRLYTNHMSTPPNQAWTEEDEGAPPAPEAPATTSGKPGDLEEAKEELSAAATVVSTALRCVVDCWVCAFFIIARPSD